MAVVARRTGLRPDVIRAWERRHRAVEPSRSGGNRRLYSEEEVQRLLLLRQAVDAGWQISQVAPLRDEEIRALLGAESRAPPRRARNAQPGARREELLALCMDDTSNLDGAQLQAHLEEAAVELGRIDVLDGLVAALVRRVGDGCATGALRIAQEHLASAVLGRFLESLQGAYRTAESAPVLLVTTPAFQHHEIGALMVAATGRMEGWKTTYLGPNLPAEEIAAAARLRQARAVALSVTLPGDDPALATELRRLGRLLRGGADLLVGGAAAPRYQPVLDEIGARRLDDLAALRSYLQTAR
jgi:DNA-binding transcriptional MerR regulator/methylmalonyl-CoA mutase cobalamin-binding subunit